MQTTTYRRGATSNVVTSMTDALGRRTDYSYDAQGDVLTATRLAGTPDAVTTTATYESTFNHIATVRAKATLAASSGDRLARGRRHRNTICQAQTRAAQEPMPQRLVAEGERLIERAGHQAVEPWWLHGARRVDCKRKPASPSAASDARGP